jgi:hypothetical protein
MRRARAPTICAQLLIAAEYPTQRALIHLMQVPARRGVHESGWAGWAVVSIQWAHRCWRYRDLCEVCLKNGARGMVAANRRPRSNVAQGHKLFACEFRCGDGKSDEAEQRRCGGSHEQGWGRARYRPWSHQRGHGPRHPGMLLRSCISVSLVSHSAQQQKSKRSHA